MFVYRDEKGRITDVTGSINVAELEKLKAGKAVSSVVTEVVQVPEEAPEPAPEPEPEPEAEPASESEPESESEETSDLPKAADNKAAWVDFAVTQGVDHADAEALTKQELIDLFKES